MYIHISTSPFGLKYIMANSTKSLKNVFFFLVLGRWIRVFFFLELEYPAGVFNHVFLPFWVFVRFQHDRSVFGCDLSRA